MPKPSVEKFDEEIGRAEYKDIERIRGPRTNLPFLFIFLILAGIVAWYFLKGKPVVYRWLHPKAKAEQEAPEPGLWVPGIDYQPQKDEGGD